MPLGSVKCTGLAVNADGEQDFVWLRLKSMVRAGLAVNAVGKRGV